MKQTEWYVNLSTCTPTYHHTPPWFLMVDWVITPVCNISLQCVWDHQAEGVHILGYWLECQHTGTVCTPEPERCLCSHYTGTGKYEFIPLPSSKVGIKANIWQRKSSSPFPSPPKKDPILFPLFSRFMGKQPKSKDYTLRKSNTKIIGCFALKTIEAKILKEAKIGLLRTHSAEVKFITRSPPPPSIH